MAKSSVLRLFIEERKRNLSQVDNGLQGLNVRTALKATAYCGLAALCLKPLMTNTLRSSILAKCQEIPGRIRRMT